MTAFQVTFLISFLVMTTSGLPRSQSDRVVFPSSEPDENSLEETTVSTTTTTTAATTAIAATVTTKTITLAPPSKADIMRCLDLGAFMPAKTNESTPPECFGLATRGPCSEREWFILEKDGVNAQCQARHCDPGSVLFKDRCEGVGNVAKCPPGMEILPNVNGEGECECREGFIPWISKEHGPVCYLEHLQGPCLEGESLVLINDNSTCIKTDCPPNHYKWTSGECLKNVECAEDYTLIFDKGSKNITCEPESFGIRTLLIVPSNCPGGSELNSDGECKDVSSGVIVRSARLANASNFRRLLLKRLR